MTCLGCETRRAGKDGVCDVCRPVFDHDNDVWTYKDDESAMLRHKINQARTDLKYADGKREEAF